MKDNEAKPATTADRVPRCPKCRSDEFTAFARELAECSAAVKAGEVIDSWSASALAERQACFGQCDCGHRWRFRDRWAIS